MVNTREETLGVMERHWNELERFGVAHLSLFGSFRRDSADESSDVDLLVEFREGEKTFRNFMSLIFFLEDYLGRRVDLVTPESISPYLRETILKEALSVRP